MTSLETILQSFHKSGFQINASQLDGSYQPYHYRGKGSNALVLSSENPKELRWMRFGYNPHWAKKPMDIVNARIEGDSNPDNHSLYQGAKAIIRKPAFRKAIRSQRCIVIVNGFIKPANAQSKGNDWLIYPDNRKPFGLAGIWDDWINPTTQEASRSFCLLTMPANDMLKGLGYARSPVIMPMSDSSRWLSKSMHLSGVTSLFKSFSKDYFNAIQLANVNAIPNPSSGEIKVIGKPLLRRSRYKMVKKMELQGMGQSSARRRRKEEEDRVKK